ncbi:MAG: hypothetical protein G01um101429_619 [Parcubacteria group bacterium Gr01-1014_29]|nr:MAG: hypothetical protein G01um101429_619 [Parcubacteria group bacterium Gr01-1014_29]
MVYKKKIIWITLFIFLICIFLVFILLSNLHTLPDHGPNLTRKRNIYELRTRLLLYYDDHKRYPEQLIDLIPPEIPSDPVTHKPYYYTVLDGGQNYTMYALLDDREKVGKKQKIFRLNSNGRTFYDEL